MVPARTDRFETTYRRIGLPNQVGSPTDNSVIATYPATMVAACADRLETTHRPGRVFSPADDRVVATYPATMAAACADSFEASRRGGVTVRG